MKLSEKKGKITQILSDRFHFSVIVVIVLFIIITIKNKVIYMMIRYWQRLSATFYQYS